MRLFFYGTLMDRDVLEAVLGRPVADGVLQDAVLQHFRRVFMHNRNYPMLRPHSAGWVNGLLAQGLDAEAVNRLVAYEGGEYHLVPVRVENSAGHLVRAGAFLADRSVLATHHDWHLPVWQRRFKRPFLRKAAELMGHYGTRTFLAHNAKGMPVLTHKDPKHLLGRPRALARGMREE